MKTIITNKLGSLLSFSILIGLLTMVSAAHAEYYMVAPGAPPVVCINCGSGHHYYHHRSYRHYPRVGSHSYDKPRHYAHRYRNSTFSMSVYYVWQASPACPCDNCNSGGEWVEVVQRVQPARYGYDFYVPDQYIDSSDRYYDPDLTTGDDDPTVDPNMDIDH